MALEGAIRGIKKTILDEEVKADLKEFYQWKKKQENCNFFARCDMMKKGV